MPQHIQVWYFEGVHVDPARDAELDIEVFDSAHMDTVVSRRLYGTKEEAIDAMTRHIRHVDRSRDYYVLPVDIIRESAYEIRQREELRRVEQLLKLYLIIDLSHVVDTLVRRDCVGCVAGDLSHRTHTCLMSPEARVALYYDYAFLNVNHVALLNQWVADMRARDSFCTFSEVQLWKYFPGSRYRSRFMNSAFHQEMQLLLENHLRIRSMPTFSAMPMPQAVSPDTSLATTMSPNSTM
jgi:hypothetical protein